MCQLKPLNHANSNGPAYDQAKPRASATTSTVASVREAYCRGPERRLRTDATMIAVFHIRTARIANPTICGRR